MCAAATPSMVDARRQDRHTAIPQISEFAIRLVRRKARKLVRHVRFNPADREDIEQDLLLALLKRLRKFNPSIAHYNAFATTVVERCVATMIEHRAAERRAPRQNNGSLHVAVDDGKGNCVELLATIVDGQQKRHGAQRSRRVEESSDLANDVADGIADLPPRLREICEQLKHDTPAEVARNLRVGRATIYERISRIRVRFEKAGLHEYLKTISDTSGADPVGNK